MMMMIVPPRYLILLTLPFMFCSFVFVIYPKKRMEILQWSQAKLQQTPPSTSGVPDGDQQVDDASPSSASLLQSGSPPADDHDLRHHLQHSLSLLRSVLHLFKLEEVALTFNGGKDACVVFNLARAAVAAYLVEKEGIDPKNVDDALAQACRRIKVR